jgi:hypothetical protein
MGDEKSKDIIAPEIKYQPDYFVRDFSALQEMFREKAILMKSIDFNDVQKAQIAGMVMMQSTIQMLFMIKLKEWGFLL